MKHILTFLLTVISVKFAFAQYAINGRVIDGRRMPARGATVSLLKTDSTIIKATLSNENGVYTFGNVQEGTYIVSIFIIGYKKYYASVILDTADVQVPEINLVLDTNMLREVTIKSVRPFLEQRADKLVVNVSRSATAVGGTALEVLQKVPGLIVTNDNVTMVGRGTPFIMVDSRPSQYTDISQVLKDISSADIDRIEVISNPGAKYDAAGGAVINIILKRNINFGTNGSISLASGVGFYDRDKDDVDRNFYRVNPSLSVNHRTGKVSFFGNYSYFQRNFYDYNTINRVINTSRFLQANYIPADTRSHNFRIGADLFAGNKNIFGIILSGFTRNGVIEANNNTQQLQVVDGQLLSSFKTINTTHTSRRNFSGNLNWKHKFDTAGKDINIDLDYSTFNIYNSGLIVNQLMNGTQYVSSQLINNPVNFGVIKGDYSHPINGKTKIDAGLKASVAIIDNLLEFTQNGIIDDNRSTDFKYTENINAGYINFITKLEKWELQAGLRSEQTLATGKLLSKKVLDRNYWQLFPSLFITRKVNSKIATILQYARRVNRPSFQQQNPFVEYLDSLTYTRGNPLLRPETADQYKFSFTYQSQPFFAVSYNRKKDVIFNNAPKQEGNLTYTTAENLASYENFTFELNFPIKIGQKVNGFGGSHFIYNRYKADYLGSTFDRGKWNRLAYWQVGYEPRDNWNLEVSGYYMTDFLHEFIAMGGLGSLNLGIQRSVLGKSGKISLNFNDILFTERTKWDIQYQDINVLFSQRSESRNARLTFSYNFGNQNLKSARNRNTGSDSEKSRVKE